MSYNEQVESYIKDCMVSSISKEQIVNNLVNAGWAQKDIDDTFATFNAPVSDRRIFSENGGDAIKANPKAPISPRVITKKEYPITLLWSFKLLIIVIFISIAGLLFGYWFPDLLLILPFLPIIYLYQRWNIKFSLDRDLMSVKGVYKIRKKSSIAVSKEKKKKSIDIPYSKIKNVQVKQDIFDRIFGLGGVLVGLSSENKKKKEGFIEKKLGPMIRGNVGDGQEDNFTIPGLTKRNAEILESIISDRMLSAGASNSDTPLVNL